MKRRLVILALAIGLFAVAWLLAAQPKEPTYEGKPLSFWMDQMDKTVSGQDPTVKALRAMGSNAVPWLVHEIQAHDSKVKLLFLSLLDRLGRPARGHVPAHRRRQRAILACYCIGAEASGTARHLEELMVTEPYSGFLYAALQRFGTNGLFSLTRAMTNSEPSAAYARIHLRDFMSAQGTNAAPTLRFLDAQLNAPDRQTRIFAATAIAVMKDLPPTIVAKLEQRLDDSDMAIRRLVTTGIIQIAVELPRFPDEKPFVPALRRALTNSDAVVRAAATNGLAQLRAPISP